MRRPTRAASLPPARPIRDPDPPERSRRRSQDPGERSRRGPPAEGPDPGRRPAAAEGRPRPNLPSMRRPGPLPTGTPAPPATPGDLPGERAADGRVGVRPPAAAFLAAALAGCRLANLRAATTAPAPDATVAAVQPAHAGPAPAHTPVTRSAVPITPAAARCARGSGRGDGVVVPRPGAGAGGVCGAAVCGALGAVTTGQPPPGWPARGRPAPSGPARPEPIPDPARARHGSGAG